MATEITEKRFVIKSADIPNQKLYFDIGVDGVLDNKLLKVYIQFVRSTTIFYKGADIFYKGRTLRCEFRYIGQDYSIKRDVYPVLDGNGGFYFFVDKEILGSRIELSIKDFGHTITFKLNLEKHNPKPTAVCWCKSEKLKTDSKEAKGDERKGSIYPNEDAFLHITTQGMFGQRAVVDIVDKSDNTLCTSVITVRKNNGVAVFSMEEIKRAFYRRNKDKAPSNSEFRARVDAVEKYFSDWLTLVIDGTKSPNPAKASPQMGTAKAVIGDKDSKEVEDYEKTNLKLSIFFDGTYNNKDNVEARELYARLGVTKSNYKQVYANTQDDKKREQLKAYHSHGEDGSFQNDKSNVAKLWDAYKEQPKRVYVEGIATEKHKGDSGLLGAGMGAGSTGIVAKVESGIKLIIGNLNESKIKELESISIDVYGFSRGAAAARHFIFEVTQNGVLGRTPPYGELGKLFQDNKITTKRLIIRFTGLFDTVSTYGVSSALWGASDVEDLQLHKVAKSRHTVQLAASDEYREKFALTRIGSCGGRGLELFLPGSHADIGGGYRNNDVAEHNKLIYESSDKSFIEKLRKELIDDGWYLEEQIEIKERLVITPNGGFASPSYYYIYSLFGKREKVSNSYSNIPLHLMRYLMEKFTGDDVFAMKKIEVKYKIADTLNSIYVRLKKFAEQTKKSGATTTELKDYEKFIPDKEDTEKANWKTLRNEHLHWSATPGLIHGPNIENKEFIRTRHEDN